MNFVNDYEHTTAATVILAATHGYRYISVGALSGAIVLLSALPEQVHKFSACSSWQVHFSSLFIQERGVTFPFFLMLFSLSLLGQGIYSVLMLTI